jgi:hypothetical protein
MHIEVKVRVKCTLVQALRLCTGHTAHRGSRGIALPFHDHSTRRGWGVSVTPWPLFTPRKDPVPIVQEAGWAPGPVWTGAENLTPTRIQSPDHPAHSQSLYRLRYPAHNFIYTSLKWMYVCMYVWLLQVHVCTHYLAWQVHKNVQQSIFPSENVTKQFHYLKSDNSCITPCSLNKPW